MPLYSYQYEMPKPELNSLSKSLYFYFGLTLGFFLFFILLFFSIFLPSIHVAFVSPIPANAEMKNANDALNDENVKNIPKENPNISEMPNQVITLSSTPTPTTIPTATPTPRPGKNFYTIAIIGDSMVDTMGEVLEYLDHALKVKYPDTKFLLYNYGKGGENVEMGLARFDSHFNYQSRNYPSLPELKPDILIVGSFAYNPFTPYDRNRHWLRLAQLVKKAETVSPEVYLLAEIAPLRKDFGKGPNGVNWSDDTNYQHSGWIIEQLQNTIGLSKSLSVPLIDTFTPTFNTETQEGQRKYVNPSDGIHPSVEGHQFIAEKIAEVLRLR